MKILLDAYHLQQLCGSGISTYSYNLASAIEASGHELHVLYGLEGASLSLQQLHRQQTSKQYETFLAAIQNQPDSQKFHGFVQQFQRLQFIAIVNAAKLLGQTAKAAKIPRAEIPVPPALARHVPESAQLWYSPSLYRRAQVVAAVLAKRSTVCFNQKLKVDLLQLCDSGLIEVKNVKKALTIHDLIPLSHPHLVNLNLDRYRDFLRLSTANADLIFTVSQYSKKKIIEILRIPEEKIVVSYQPSVIEPEYLQLSFNDIQPLLNLKQLQARQYFLYFGNIEPKKNVLHLLHAFQKARTNCRLVLIGRDGWLCKGEKAFFAEQHENFRFLRIPYVSFDILMKLLKGARALLFPSFCEGFGLPVLEAMQMGCPVVTSYTSSLPEVGGDAVHYVDPYSQSEMVFAIEKLSTDDLYCQKLHQKGLIQAQNFSMETFQNRLNTAYRQLF